MVARAGIEPATFRFSGGRSYQLSYLAGRQTQLHYCLAVLATLTGLEPATSAVTGRRANQLRHRALLCSQYDWLRTPNGIRTRATAVKGRRPRPLDDGGPFRISPGYPQRVSRWELAQLRAQLPQNPNRITSVLARTLDQYPVSARPYSSVGRATDF